MPISHGHKPFVYSPFVAEMDGRDLVTAVELKQNLYDQGVASIQAKMDQLSGFDIARDVDRKYANQELTKIYSIIQKNAHSDFSNPQTVKSFLDISRPLEKDPILRSAIDSTAELRNRQKTLNDVRTKHPEQYNAANEWDYMQDAYKWMSNETPGAQLNTKYYKPYVNASKEWFEIKKNITPQIESKFRNMGNFISEEQRTFMTDDAIKKALLVSMSPQALAQMDIDARYSMAGLSTEEKYNRVMDFYKDAYKKYSALSQVKGIENTGTTAEEYRTEADAINTVTKSLENPETGFIDEDKLNRLAANLYTDNWREGIGKAYAYSQSVTKWETNPYSLSKFNADQQYSNMEKKAKLDFDYRVKSGELIQTAPGVYTYNPAYYQAKHKSKEEYIPSLLDMIAGNNEAFGKLPIGADGYFTPGANVELKKDEVHPSLLTAIQDLQSKQGETDVNDFKTIRVVTDANGNPTIEVTNKDGDDVTYTFTEEQLAPYLNLDSATPTSKTTTSGTGTAPILFNSPFLQGDMNPDDEILNQFVTE